MPVSLSVGTKSSSEYRDKCETSSTTEAAYNQYRHHYQDDRIPGSSRNMKKLTHEKINIIEDVYVINQKTHCKKQYLVILWVISIAFQNLICVIALHFYSFVFEVTWTA